MTANGNTNFFSQAWLVLVLAICFGGLLAGMQIVLGPTIEANKINETLERVPVLVFGKAHATELSQSGMEINPLSVGVEKAGRTVRYNVYETKSDGKLAGWVTKSTGQGYADKIEILIGDAFGGMVHELDHDESIGGRDIRVVPRRLRQMADRIDHHQCSLPAAGPVLPPNPAVLVVPMGQLGLQPLVDFSLTVSPVIASVCHRASPLGKF